MLINKAVLFVSEAACVLNCSSHKIYDLIHRKKLPAYKIPGHKRWNIPEQSIQNYIDAQVRLYASVH